VVICESYVVRGEGKSLTWVGGESPLQSYTELSRR